MSTQTWKFIVEAPEADLRLDQLISSRTGLSRRKAREVLQLGGVQVAKKRVRVASKLVPSGTEIRVSLDEGLGEPPDLDLEVIFEDEWLLVLNKPAGIPTQGTQASDRHDLMALVAKKRPGLRAILCHRLDQGTSGVLVLAKDARADLGRHFQERTIRKIYLARVAQPVNACVLDRPIGRVRLSKPARFGCEGDLLDPKSSITEFRSPTEAEATGLSTGNWVVAEPKTGRTHQIRVHLAFLGSPVLGDGLYGGEPADQLWLHAWKLLLKHPVTGEDLVLVATPHRFLPVGE